jgi:hypothetical protein
VSTIAFKKLVIFQSQDLVCVSSHHLSCYGADLGPWDPEENVNEIALYVNQKGLRKEGG